ncbi:MAG TPA: oligopeptidase B, partial [Terriglobales bacterium]|nr:oligopeptidase B [Terriglobales bacterium]
MPEHLPPAPPLAKRVPKVDVIHGEKRQDDYFWMRQKDHPDVLSHLRAENAYTDQVMKPTEVFQEALYGELLGRIKEDDQSVPYRRGAWLYYSRMEKGKQYAIHCRKKAPEAAEEIVLDLNALAEGHAFIDLGAYQVSDDGRRLAYTIDVTGFREYTLYVKDLVTGEVLPDRVEKVSTVAWSADDAVLFYVT